MASLADQRCLNHALREAVARCPECRRFFCRECVVEHDDRMVCSSCLRKLAEQKSVGTRRLIATWRVVQFMGCVFVLWIFFFLMGHALLKIPSVTHDESLWVINGADDQ